jgi:hypothetical protein
MFLTHLSGFVPPATPAQVPAAGAKDQREGRATQTVTGFGLAGSMP